MKWTQLFGYDAELVLRDRGGWEHRVRLPLLVRFVEGQPVLDMEEVLRQIDDAKMKGRLH